MRRSSARCLRVNSPNAGMSRHDRDQVIDVARKLRALDNLRAALHGPFEYRQVLTVFSLLFGIGFALQAVRLNATGRAFTRLNLRRVLLLAAFGGAHAALLCP